jgi:hypothetical protein
VGSDQTEALGPTTSRGRGRKRPEVTSAKLIKSRDMCWPMISRAQK